MVPFRRQHRTCSVWLHFQKPQVRPNSKQCMGLPGGWQDWKLTSKLVIRHGEREWRCLMKGCGEMRSAGDCGFLGAQVEIKFMK